MPPSEHDEESQLTTTNATTMPEEESQMELEPDQQAPTKKRKPRDPQATALVHVPGKSLFPVSRVQKILKADKVLLYLTHPDVDSSLFGMDM